jgi:hypothetical protein
MTSADELQTAAADGGTRGDAAENRLKSAAADCGICRDGTAANGLYSPAVDVVFRATPSKSSLKPDSIALMKPEIPPNAVIRPPSVPNEVTLASSALI